MIELVKNEEIVYCIILRSNYNKEGVNFFTEQSDRMQIGSLNYKKGKLIEPHFHKKISRVSQKCAETIFVKKGKLKVNFYDPKNFDFLEYKILGPNDVILINDGAHGFEVIDDVEMIEVKLGPYHSDDLVRRK